MRKILLATVATVALLGSTAANADYYRHRHGGYHGGGGHRGGWVAPLVGGLILGGALYGLSQQPTYAAPPPYQPYYREPVCRDVIVGRDAWNRPVYQFVCE